MEEIKDIADIGTEGLVLGCLYKNPNLLMEYEEVIHPEYDFFYPQTRFLYNLLRQIYHQQYSKIDEIIINVELAKDEEAAKQFKELGGHKTIQRLISKVNLDDFQKYYDDLKKYNMLRELEAKGFPVRKKLDKHLESPPEGIYKYYDGQLAKIFSHYENIYDSIILGKNMTSIYEEWKKEPDIGIDIPFPLMNELIRGWRIKKLNMHGLHSGLGKSRMIVLLAMHVSLVLGQPLLIIANEQDEEEFNAMLLTAVVNNIFAPKTKILIDETTIVKGECTKEQDEICRQASKWIEKRTKIYFQEAQIYDYNTLRRILKIHNAKGVKYFIYDTFKAFRGEPGATWENFVKTSEELKKLCGSRKKGGLEMAGWATFQLTDDSLFDSFLTSQAIASGKQIKHNVDFLTLGRPLSYKEKTKLIQVKLVGNDVLGNRIMPLDPDKEYYIFFIDKNRGGPGKQKIIYEVDLGHMIFRELGYAVFKSKEDEEAIMNREKSKQQK